MATFGNVTISGGLVLGSGSAPPPAPSFSPDGGSTAGTAVPLEENGGPGTVEVTITCTDTATWTWTRTGSPAGIASVSSGGSATSITFSLTNNSPVTLASSFDVVGTSGSVTRYWDVSLINTGTQ